MFQQLRILIKVILLFLKSFFIVFELLPISKGIISQAWLFSIGSKPFYLEKKVPAPVELSGNWTGVVLRWEGIQPPFYKTAISFPMFLSKIL